MDDDVELRRLRERVYGVDGAAATPAMIARLAELEENARRPPIVEDPPADVPDAEPPTPADDVTEPSTRRPALRWALIGVGAVALVSVGVAIGSTFAAPPSTAATADPAEASLPELTFPQTAEDVISAEILSDSGIDPASTRYIATVSDFRIYLARPDDGDGRCIATFTSSENRPWSAGCASGAQVGAAVFGIDERLTVAIGEPVSSGVDGIPIRLSDSVTAFVAR
ncbi:MULTISPECIES: hypothetical protein [Microbacterium]|uniref:hypothetical protein n=1 Tax=Microbacterium TaxID=33882 RepID=UPI00278274FA|nr:MULTISPECIES: hypothetical protein [Microbacterium]MDQ1075247.1 hypothetical protein [Microbacterium sp. SORGH_AS_0969]MDQ1115478.1 hypothetical protein [Microbacterium testaceum]